MGRGLGGIILRLYLTARVGVAHVARVGHDALQQEKGVTKKKIFCRMGRGVVEEKGNDKTGIVLV